MKVIMLKRAIALPREIGSKVAALTQAHRCQSVYSTPILPQISASTPGEFDSAALQSVPVRNRPTSSPAKFGVKAHKKVNAKYKIKVK